MTYDIAVIPGDGIGPEVVREALKVLEVVAERSGFDVRVHRYPHGADHYLKTGETFPDGILDEIKGMRAHVHQPAADPPLRRASLPAQGQAPRGS
jgi:3-isopropylmalate dehydrogenase